MIQFIYGIYGFHTEKVGCDKIELVREDTLYKVYRYNLKAGRVLMSFQNKLESKCREYISGLLGFDIDSIPF